MTEWSACVQVSEWEGGEVVMAANSIPAVVNMRAVLTLQLFFFFSIFMPLIVGAKPLEAVVSSCASCTATNATASWCPDDMSCQLASNCSCSSACMGISDCFLQETSCSGCIQSGGVFCSNPIKAGKPCLFPDVPAAHDGSGAVMLQQCNNGCQMGGRCISALAQCPNEPVDHSLLAWFIVNLTTTVVIAVPLAFLMYRVLMASKLGRSIHAVRAEHEKVYG